MAENETPIEADEEEAVPIRPKEIVLFLVFGFVPILALYFFASSGLSDESGKAFEQDRRVVMQECIDAGIERLDCREVVDAKIEECWQKHQGDRINVCILGEFADWAAASRDAKRRAKEEAEKRDRGRFAKPKKQDAPAE